MAAHPTPYKRLLPGKRGIFFIWQRVQNEGRCGTFTYHDLVLPQDRASHSLSLQLSRGAFQTSGWPFYRGGRRELRTKCRTINRIFISISKIDSKQEWKENGSWSSAYMHSQTSKAIAKNEALIDSGHTRSTGSSTPARLSPIIKIDRKSFEVYLSPISFKVPYRAQIRCERRKICTCSAQLRTA